MLTPSADFRYQGFVEYNDTIRAIAKASGVAFVDVAAAVSEASLFLPDAIHNTRAGVERVAEVLYGPLEQLVQEVIREREEGSRGPNPPTP